jgi:hypothetical protein
VTESEKRTVKEVRVAELKDAPDHWLITPIGPDGEEGGKRLRKPNGTFWEVTAMHYFPPGGGALSVDIGNQISDGNTIRILETWYREARANIDAARTSPEK